jgi:ParB-like chromosome segregation protein Spo0J
MTDQLLGSTDRGLGATRDVRLDELTFGLSPRSDGTDRDVVAALVEVFERLPPILVYRPTMAVIDGAHRVEAARQRGDRTISATMYDGTPSEAFIVAVQTNIAHGRPLTLHDRCRAALRILGEHADRSDRWLSDLCGLSPATVAKLRQAEAGVDGARVSASRVGRDGRRRPLDPGPLRDRIAEAAAEHPDASLRAIARIVGVSPSTVHGVIKGRSGARAPQVPGDANVGLGNGGVDGLRLLVGADDSAFGSCPELAGFQEWLDATGVSELDWRPFVPDLPMGRSYQVADECRRRAHSWLAFAAAVEEHARLAHRRR